MQPSDITFSDSLIILVHFGSLILLILGWKRALPGDAKFILAGILSLATLHDISNTLIFTRITDVLDRYGDFLRVLIANLWAFFFYSNIQGEINRELKAAKEEAERQNIALKKLDKIKDNLLRDVSHELKTPVAKISMELELLKDKLAKGGLAGDAVEMIAVMEKAIRRQEKVIRNIMELSRLEGGGRKYLIQAVPLHVLLAEIIEDFHAEMNALGIALSVNFEEMEVRSDRSMLWHVFSNLISNAIKFRDKADGACIYVSLARADGGALVTIRDNGKGMDREDLEHAFDAFYKAEPSIEGSGLGLSIVRKIIQDLGGSVRIDSEGRGKGTTVFVSL